jgi:SHS2 domain-containing protein
MSFEEIEHTADRAFRVTGRDVPELLVNAARAMHALEGVSSRETSAETSATHDLEVEGIDAESLLVNWLNEILFLEQENRAMCEKFEIHELKGFRLRARVETRKCSDYQTGIKAVTFHNLKICKTTAGLEAEVVVDV